MTSERPENALGDLVREHADLSAYLDRHAAMRLTLSRLLDGTGDVGWIGTNQDGSGVRLDATDGDRSGSLRGLIVPGGQGLTGKVLASTRSEWVDDYSRSESITHIFDRQIEQEGIRRLLAAPLIWDGRVLGVIAVGSRDEGEYGDRSIERVERIAEQAALAQSIADGAALARQLAVQNERTRLSAELHDNVGALLYAIGSRVEGIAELAGVSDPELTNQIERLRGHAAAASSALRESLRTLRSPPASLGMVAALDGDRLAFTERTAVPAELVVVDEPPHIPHSRSEVIITGVREALLNIEKHADASAVVITVVAGRSHLTVAVTDDGTGLPRPLRRGIGLTKTQDAVERLGGTLDVASATPDDGTTWRIRMPL